MEIWKYITYYFRNFIGKAFCYMKEVIGWNIKELLNRKFI